MITKTTWVTTWCLQVWLQEHWRGTRGRRQIPRPRCRVTEARWPADQRAVASSSSSSSLSAPCPVSSPASSARQRREIVVVVHCVSKNIPDVCSYNSRKHCQIFIIFGRIITEIVSNQRMPYFFQLQYLAKLKTWKCIFSRKCSCWFANRHTSHIGIIT